MKKIEGFIAFIWLALGLSYLYNREVTNMLVCFCLMKLAFISVDLEILKETLEKENV